jgi:hypothetical protein
MRNGCGILVQARDRSLLPNRGVISNVAFEKHFLHEPRKTCYLPRCSSLHILISHWMFQNSRDDLTPRYR